MKKIISLLIMSAVVFISCISDKTVVVKEDRVLIQEEKSAGQEEIKEMEIRPMKAIIETSLGTIEIDLFADKAPKTVENFVGLAEGTKEFTDVKTGEKTKKKFYDGLIFHRVIPEFMIQGGCPLGTGTGGPGYTFEDETDNGLKFSKPGLLAMANAGPNTNGSQFFITEVNTPWLNGHHTIFGEVADAESFAVVKKIAHLETDFSDRPVEPVYIKKITIEKK